MPVADSTFLVDVLRGDAEALEELARIRAEGRVVWIPSPALQELCYGARRSPAPRRELARVRGLERAMPALSLHPPAGRLAGLLEADAERAGKKAGVIDIQIASIATLRGEPVVSRDRRFPRVKGLGVRAY